MAKTKSENVEQRRRKRQKAEPIVRSNPFELRVNKEKFKILGRKSKHDKGLPGLSRTKANKKRKDTLLQEYKHRNKTSSFVDKRFGEYDNEISLEERMLQRFTLEKQKHHESRKLYNLEDDEDLTHYGQSLAEMTNFDDADLQLTDDEQDEEKTDEAHFGGFLKKVGNSQEKDDRPKSKKEIMAEVVAKSKIKKFERQQAKEEAFQLTQNLDTDWKMIRNLLVKRDDAEMIKADEYDILVNELKYETKAKPKDRMKTEEEIAKAEKEELQRLEEERLIRMQSIEVNGQSHISADYLGESHQPKEDKRIELIFKDGKAVLPESALDSVDQSEDEEESEDADDDSDEDLEGSSEDGDENKDSDVENSEEESSDEEMSSEQLDTGETHEQEIGKQISRQKRVRVEDSLTSRNKQPSKVMQSKKQSSKKGGEMTKELPFTFEAPKNLEEFLKLMQEWNFEQQFCIINRIRKCHPAKLEEKNKRKMETLFVILLKYVDHLCEQESIPIGFINKLARPIFELAKDSVHHAVLEIQRRLRQSFKKLWMKHQTSGGRNAMPGLKEILLLNIVSTIFPTSDLKHQVTTPAMTFMVAALSKSYLQTSADIISGLFVSSTISNWISLSKRFVPEVINFLCGILCMATSPNDELIYKSTLRMNNKSKNSLFLKESTLDVYKLKILDIVKLKDEEIWNMGLPTKISVIASCLHLTKKFAEIYKDLSCFVEIFIPVGQCLHLIPDNKFPQQLQKQISELKDMISSDTTRKPLALLARKPVPLPLLEPMFDESYEIKSKKKSKDKDANERSKLKYKYNKEMKGAIREVRKDSQFLAKEKLHERLDRDAERRQKIKEIERQLADQQGDLKSLNKLKRKFKK